MGKVRILSIDPGSRKAGFAVVESIDKKLQYIDSGVLDIYQKSDEFIDRLGHVHELTCELIKNYNPDEIALEALIYVKSPTALIKLAQARGAMLGAFGLDYKGKLFEYSPNKVKLMTVGYGHASKEEIEKFVSLLLGIEKFKSHDESDALAVAICHAFYRTSLDRKIQNELKKSKKTLYKPKRNMSSGLGHMIREKL